MRKVSKSIHFCSSLIVQELGPSRVLGRVWKVTALWFLSINIYLMFNNLRLHAPCIYDSEEMFSWVCYGVNRALITKGNNGSLVGGKFPWLKNVYKSNRRCLKPFSNNGNKNLRNKPTGAPSSIYKRTLLCRWKQHIHKPSWSNRDDNPGFKPWEQRGNAQLRPHDFLCSGNSYSSL